MSPGLISRVVVADKVAAIRRMLDGARSLPLAAHPDRLSDKE